MLFQAPVLFQPWPVLFQLGLVLFQPNQVLFHPAAVVLMASQGQLKFQGPVTLKTSLVVRLTIGDALLKPSSMAAHDNCPLSAKIAKEQNHYVPDGQA